MASSPSQEQQISLSICSKATFWVLRQSGLRPPHPSHCGRRVTPVGTGLPRAPESRRFDVSACDL